MKQIGHTGTLDPGASGVLPLVVGKATRLSQYLTEHDKVYLAELTLGISTTTQDGGGATVEMNTEFAVTPWRLADVLASFQGEIEQVPPMASAVRVGGANACTSWRAGGESRCPAPSAGFMCIRLTLSAFGVRTSPNWVSAPEFYCALPVQRVHIYVLYAMTWAPN